MKRLNRNLLVITLAAATTLGAFAMENPLEIKDPVSYPGITNRLHGIFVELFGLPEQSNFNRAKELINALTSGEDINVVDPFVTGNLLDLATWRSQQFSKTQPQYAAKYAEIIELLKSKGATRSNLSNVTPDEPQ